MVLLLLCGVLPRPLGAQATQALADSAWVLFRAARTAYDEPAGAGRARAAAGWEAAARLYDQAGRPADQANALGWVCRVRAEMDAPAAALEPCRLALRHYEQIDSLGDQARTHYRIGDLHRALQQPDSARAQFDAARRLYEQLGRHSWAGSTYDRLGRLHYAAGRLDSAVTAFLGALEQRRLAGDSADQAAALDWLGFLERERRRPEAALARYQEALPLYQRFGPDASRRQVDRALGELFERVPLRDSAIVHLTRSLGVPPLGTPGAEARVLQVLGDLYLPANPDSAVAYYRAAQALIDAGADFRGKVYVIRGLAIAYYHTKQLDSAAATFTRAISVHRAAGDSGLLASASGWLGKVETDRGRADAAIRAYREALAWYPAAAGAVALAALHKELALLFESQGQHDSAAVHARAAATGNVDSAYAAIPGGTAPASPHLRQVPLGLDRRQVDSALAELRRALARAEPAADRAATLRQLADVFIRARRPDSALVYQRAAVAAYRELIRAYPEGSAPRLLGEMHSAIGQLFEQLGQLDSMQAHFRIAIAAGISTTVDSALRLTQVGSTLANRGQPDSAIAVFLEAARRFDDKGSQGLRNTMLTRVALLFRDQGRLDSALSYGRRLVADWRRLGNPAEEAFTLMLVAGLHLQRGEFDSALRGSAAGFAVLPAQSEARLRATLHGVRGTAFASTGHYDSALVHHRAAVAAWHEAGDAYRQFEGARATGQLGSIFRQLGQFDSALAYHRAERGMVLAGTSGELKAIGAIAFDFEAAGGRDSALHYQQERKQLARFRREHTSSDPVGDARAESDALERIGLLLSERGDTAAAGAAFVEALAAYRRGGTAGLDAAALGDLASLFERVGEDDSALAYHRLSLARADTVGAGGDAALALAAIGRLETRRGDPEAGLAALRRALAYHRGAGSLEISAAVLGSIGYTLRRLPRPDLPGALAAFDSAAVLRAAVRAEAGGDENRLSITEQGTLPAGEWELAWLGRASAIGPEPAALGALAAAERGRGQALLDLMRRTSVARRAGADFPAEGRRLAAAATRSGAGLLAYLVTDDTLLVWYARPAAGRAGALQMSAYRVPVSADSLARLVERWRAALGVDRAAVGGRLAGPSEPPLEEQTRTGVAGVAAAGGDPAPIGAELARLLLPPALRGAGRGQPRELVIVPHGALTVIPFGALPLGDSTAALGIRHALRQVPSLASLAEVERHPAPAGGAIRARRLRQALVVGDPQMPVPHNGDGVALTLRPLPAAAAEGRAVAARLGATPLSGPAASETAVRRRMAGAPLIHLATHGYAYADAGRARNSFVALAPDSSADGLLTVGEVLDDRALSLGADLVVLSACQTGLGNLQQAEGTVGLQRAFLARGARSLLVSLWSVSDEATALLMERFYLHWLADPDGPAKPEALRRAQADLRRTPGFAAPRYWAPFMLVGAR